MVDIPQFTYENSVRDDRACSCPTSVYKNVPRVDVTLTLYVSSAGSVEHERKVTKNMKMFLGGKETFWKFEYLTLI